MKRDPTHAPFSQAVKKASIQVAFSQPTVESTFLNTPIIDYGLMNVEIGLPNGPNPITLEVLRANSVFYADSGATAHVTYEKHLLRNVITVPKGSWVIQGFRGAQAEVQCYGDIDFEATVHNQKRVGTLKRVLYAPETGVNLISIGQITALGTDVFFSGEKCEFVRNKEVEATGRRIGFSLYKIDMKAIAPFSSPKEERALVAKQPAVSSAPLMTWHHRLSHVNCKTIQKMESSNAVDGMIITDNKIDPICEGCIFGKMCRRSFPCSSTDPNTQEVGQLIVSDVGGPMQEKSLSGALYYLAIKDKASGLRKVYFLKHKSEVAGKFKIYVPSFQNDTGKLIKAFRTDNGGEFKGQAWIWADELGIKRQYTISHTPQQNGASERDNRTIVEAARAALYGRKHPVSPRVLLRLWAEAVNYAVYTLNRILSRRRNITPFEKY